jgi:tRNA(His) guanylyltransferase
MGKNKSLSDRMKDYESCYGFKVPNRSLMVVRLDGVGFSKYTKNFKKPFDDLLSDVMDATTVELCKTFNPVMGYTQSDEISLVFTTTDNIDSELIYDGKVQKICSIMAGKATAVFNKNMVQMLANFKYADMDVLAKIKTGKFVELDAFFDARVFVLPEMTEVYNYLTWRQQDCTRNSVSMAASAYFSHQSLEGVKSADKQERLFKEKGINWNDYKTKYKRGLVVSRKSVVIDGPNDTILNRNKWLADLEIPIFTQDREYLQKLFSVTK